MSVQANSIQFPYSDMSDAIAVAEGMLKGGGVPLSRDQLAAAMGLAPGGGGFSTKVATARTFGVLEGANGKYQLTELGHEIVDASRASEAKVKAFMNVPLFKRTYDEFRGKLLPPRPHGLDAAFMNFGVTQKNTRHARLAFEKSARLAGMYPGGNEDRLVMPFGQGAPASPDNPKVVSPHDASHEVVIDAAPVEQILAGTAAPPTKIHKSILGMLDELPPSKTQWSKEDQADWLQALATMFQVIYKSDDKGEITVKYEPALA